MQIKADLEKALDLPKGTHGVYVIIHKRTGRAYIGSSKDVRGRVKSHRASLNRGKHHCKFLQRLWSNGQEQAFDFRLLTRSAPGQQLLELEQAWMDAARAEGLLINTYKTAHRPGVSKYQRMDASVPGWLFGGCGVVAAFAVHPALGALLGALLGLVAAVVAGIGALVGKASGNENAGTQAG